MCKTACAVKRNLKRRRIDTVDNYAETCEPFFGGLPQEGKRQVQVFGPCETPPRTLRTEPLLDFNYPILNLVIEIYRNKKTHNLCLLMHNGRQVLTPGIHQGLQFRKHGFVHLLGNRENVINRFVGVAADESGVYDKPQINHVGDAIGYF